MNQFGVNGRLRRKTMIDRMVRQSLRRFGQNIDTMSWQNAVDCHKLYLAEVARIYGCNFAHIVGKAEDYSY